MHNESLSPIRLIYVQMDRSERDHFARQIVAFGDRFGFKTSIRQIPVDPDEITFYLARNNIQFWGTKNSEQATQKLQFSLAFYGQFGEPSPSFGQIDPLMKSLKSFLADVPGLTITKEQ